MANKTRPDIHLNVKKLPTVLNQKNGLAQPFDTRSQSLARVARMRHHDVAGCMLK